MHIEKDKHTQEDVMYIGKSKGPEFAAPALFFFVTH